MIKNGLYLQLQQNFAIQSPSPTSVVRYFLSTKKQTIIDKLSYLKTSTFFSQYHMISEV